MKYITNVKSGDDVKHIVEVEGENVEVIQKCEKVRYGNRKGEQPFLANGVNVTKDLHFNSSNGNDFVHLAKVVLAIELVRFVLNHLGGGKA